MKNRALEWIIGTVTIIAIGLGSFIGLSFDSRLITAGVRIERLSEEVTKVEEKRRNNETDIAVMKEILGQVNTRTYQMDQTLDRIDKDLHKKK